MGDVLALSTVPERCEEDEGREAHLMDVVKMMGLGLSVFPAWILQLESVTILNLHSNNLTALPDDIDQLATLRDLVVAGNRLTALPDSLCRLSKLRMLSVIDNRLMALPARLGDLTELKALGIALNQLERLPPGVSRLTKLARLVLSHNTELCNALRQSRVITDECYLTGSATLQPDLIPAVLRHFEDEAAALAPAISSLSLSDST